jgi:predicted Zn-dependent protease
MGLIISNLSASSTVTHDDAGLIAVTGAIAFSKHQGSGSHDMPDIETYFYVAGTPGTNTKSYFGGDLDIKGALDLDSSLDVSGSAIFNDELNVKKRFVGEGEVDLKSSLAVTGAAALNSTLRVSGATDLKSSLAVTGAANFGSTVNVLGTFDANTSQVFLGSSGSATVAGEATFEDVKFVNLTQDIITIAYSDMVGSPSTPATRIVVSGNTITINLGFGGALKSDIVAAINSNPEASLLVEAFLVGDDVNWSKFGSGTFGTVPVGSEGSSSLTIVRGELEVSSNLLVTGAADLGSTLKVFGATDLKSSLAVTGAADLGSTLKVSGATDLKSSLAVTGAADLGSTLKVSGITDLKSNLIVTGAANLASNLVVSGATDLKSSLAVTGAANFGSTLKVSGETDLKSNLLVTGAADLGSTLKVSGETDLKSSLLVTGAADLGSTLKVSGETDLKSSLLVTGATDLGSTLKVSGATDLKSSLLVTGAADLGSTLKVSDATDLKSSLAVTGAANFGSTVNVLGTFDANTSQVFLGSSGTAGVAGEATFEDVKFVNLTQDIITIAYSDMVGSPSTPASRIVVSGNTITINLGFGGALKSDIVAAINANSQANVLVTASLVGDDVNWSKFGSETFGTVPVGSAGGSSSTIVRGELEVSSELVVTGAAELGSTLRVSGATDLKSSLVVTGAAEFIGNVVIKNSLFDVTSSSGKLNLESLDVKTTNNIALSASNVFLTGAVYVSQDPTSALQVATKAYVDAYVSGTIAESASGPFYISGSGEYNVTGTGFSINESDTIEFRGTQNEIEISISTIEADTKFAIQVGLPDNVSINNNLTIGGDLIVNGEVTTLNTANLLIEDAVIGLASGAISYNSNGGLAIFSGSSNSDLVIGRVDTDTWGVGKKETLGGTVTTLTDMSLVNMRASRFEINGSSNYLDVVDSDLKAVAAQNAIISAGSDIELNADGADFLFKDGAQLGLKLSISNQDMLFQDASGAEIFRINDSRDSLLMASGKKIELGDSTRYIHNDTNDIKMVGGALIKIEAGSNLELNADGGEISFKDGAQLGLKLNIGTSADLGDAIFKDADNAEIFRIDASANSLLMSGTNKIEFGSANNSFGLNGSNDFVLDFQGDLTVDAGGGNILFKINNHTKGEFVLDNPEFLIKSNTAGLIMDSLTGEISFQKSGARFLQFNETAILPHVDKGLDLGSSSKRFNNIYTGDLHLQNDRGHWTLIEEENFITFRNNKNGRRFKMIMEDITGTGSYGPGNDGEM